MTKRTYGGPLIDMAGAVDLHCHPYPDLFPRLADDFDIVRAARDAGLKAIVLKCHHENTVSRAYLVQRVIPGIRVFGGIVLNYYVGGINPAAVEASLKLGGKEVWMPTVDAGYHAEVHGGTGGYDSQAGGRSQAEGIWVADRDGKLRPEVKEARERGVLFDVGHGSNSFDFDVAEKCLQQNLSPDTISSDIATTSINGPNYDLITTASKFLALGLNLDQVIERVTIRPTRMFNFGIELGTLRPGTGADISILEVREGTFLFMDTDGKKRTGRQKLQSVAAIRAGRLYVNRSEDLASV